MEQFFHSKASNTIANFRYRIYTFIATYWHSQCIHLKRFIYIEHNEKIKRIFSGIVKREIFSVDNQVKFSAINLKDMKNLAPLRNVLKKIICNIDILGCRYGHQSIWVRANRIK